MATKQAPLIFALKHLRVEWDSDDSTGNARLMQGDREIPKAPMERVKTFLAEPIPNGRLPEDFELVMLDHAFGPLIPKEVKVSFDGISKFGAKRIADAGRCAHEALSLNSNCRLARQLLSLLLAKSEVRLPFGGTADSAPDVPNIIAQEVR